MRRAVRIASRDTAPRPSRAAKNAHAPSMACECASQPQESVRFVDRRFAGRLESCGRCLFTGFDAVCAAHAALTVPNNLLLPLLLAAMVDVRTAGVCTTRSVCSFQGLLAKQLAGASPASLPLLEHDGGDGAQRADRNKRDDGGAELEFPVANLRVERRFKASRVSHRASAVEMQAKHLRKARNSRQSAAAGGAAGLAMALRLAV